MRTSSSEIRVLDWAEILGARRREASNPRDRFLVQIIPWDPKSSTRLTLLPSCLRSPVAVDVIGALVNSELDALSVTGSVDDEVKSPSNAGTNVLQVHRPVLKLEGYEISPV